jgi:demethoxyubiquinone hydroxylase (CLK1/Coq7/Cat5 family)
MQQAAIEEQDHLAWCEDRLKELDSHTSVLNPIWYGLSYGMGAIAGIAGDKYSLGLSLKRNVKSANIYRNIFNNFHLMMIVHVKF